MLSYDDLDEEITPGLAGDPEPAPVLPEGRPDPLVPGSPVARALYLVWSGNPVTLVDSPPGAGKSSLVTQVVSHLHDGSGMTIAVGTPTRRQAVDLALRIAEKLPPESVLLRTRNIRRSEIPEGRADDVALLTSPSTAAGVPAPRRVEVNTLAAMKFGKPIADVLIVDEAYQTTFADLLAVAGGSRQLLLVGDPGQIGPVVTVPTQAWDRMTNAPHRRAPEVFAAREDAVAVHLPCTYRFGADTVAAIAPLYDFPFTSARPGRHLRDTAEVESVRFYGDPEPHDLGMLGEVAARAASMVGRRLVADNEPERELVDQDVAVVVSHNAQVGMIRGHLAQMGHPGIAVGTADKMQGGQWEAVVALDPLLGAAAFDSHSLSPGRLCVMVSRHRTHLTFIHDGRWAQLLADDPDVPADVRDRCTAVRERLTAL